MNPQKLIEWLDERIKAYDSISKIAYGEDKRLAFVSKHAYRNTKHYIEEQLESEKGGRG